MRRFAVRLTFVMTLLSAVLTGGLPATTLTGAHGNRNHGREIQRDVSDPGQERAPDEHTTSVVTVTGGVRGTITAVHSGSPPKESGTSEGWWMAVSGLALMLISAAAFFSPKVFMYGRRSWFWRELIGEKATAIMIRVVSFIVGAAGALVTLGGIFIILEG